MAADYIRLPFVPQVFKERSSVKLEGLASPTGFEPVLPCLEDRCLVPLGHGEKVSRNFYILPLMSICTDCSCELSPQNAYKKQARLLSRCKRCFNAYCMRRWVERKLKAIEVKGGCCFDCGGRFPYQVYDFHHLNPMDKEFDWNQMRLVSDVRLQAELGKCVLLCANCHRIRHIVS